MRVEVDSMRVAVVEAAEQEDVVAVDGREG